MIVLFLYFAYKTDTMFFFFILYTQNIYSYQRIGPHDKDVLSILVGNLLGDGNAEKRKNSTNFHIRIISRSVEYASWMHKFFTLKGIKGYSSAMKPVVYWIK